MVIGVGGLGHLGVQILRPRPQPGSSPSTAARGPGAGAGRRFGTELADGSDEHAAAAVKDRTDGHGADVVLDFVGSDATLALGAAVVRTLGDLTIVGIAGGTLDRSVLLAAVRGVRADHVLGQPPELVEVLDLAGRGLITPHITTFPLSGAADAYRQLAEGKVTGRAVIVP